MLAQSVDVERNRSASSGGIIKEVLTARLRDPEVDGAIVLAREEGIEYRPTLITSPDEVDDLPGSIYHNTPKDRVLELLRANEGRFVVVAIPCELEGLYQYVLRLQPELLGRIHSTIGLLCGWQNTRHALRAICDFKDVDFDRLESVSYRGGGPLGELRLGTDEGVTTVNRRRDLDHLVAFDRSFTMPRCHLCINHNNFLADIVVGDAWVDETSSTETGVSIVINRRESTDALMRQLADEGRVVVVDVDTDVVERSQKPRVAFGNFSYAYADFLRDRGVPAPLMDGPNRPVAELVDRDEVERFHTEFEAKRRLQRQRRYGWLRIRKVTKELRRFIGNSQELKRIRRRWARRLGLARDADPVIEERESTLPFR
nr:Coenzyme F420 hydrogenase/dehydrogenase, beta subunit C-terminal domain [Salsipaludibacter albus]